MLEKITKTLVTIMALSFLFWVFWNPTPKKAKSKAAKDKTEASTKKWKGDKNKKRSRARNKKAQKLTKQARENRQSIPGVPEPAEDEAYLVVTGNVRTVRFRTPAGKIFGPGEIPAGQYDILTRDQGEVTEHGTIELLAGDRKRIDCDDDGCRLWKPKQK